MSAHSMTRVDELHADIAIWGWDRELVRKLERALAEANLHPDARWEHSAAVTTLALQEDYLSAPPPRLIKSLRASAPARLETRGAARRRMRFTHCLVAAAVLWSDWDVDRSAPELRRALMETRDASVWSSEQGSVQGDVAWDSTSQRGYMRFRNLEVNDPAMSQHQLWIIDANRYPAHPVNGGVFYIPRGQAEVTIPVVPAILAHNAQTFVVTVESPGGVVVSDRQQVVTVAKFPIRA